MKILRDEFFEQEKYTKFLNLDTFFVDKRINDSLIKKIIKCSCDIEGYLISDDEIHLKLDIHSKIDYLDANTLKPVVIDVDFVEVVPFTTNKKKSEELDIDYLGKEIDITDLIYQLILVSIPMYYSEENNDLVSNNEIIGNNPFANIFNKK